MRKKQKQQRIDMPTLSLLEEIKEIAMRNLSLAQWRIVRRNLDIIYERLVSKEDKQ